MEEKTADELAQMYSACADSVSRINKDANFAAWQERHPHENRLTENDWKEMIQRNVEHLEHIKDYKKLDEKTSVWTTESFTDIDAAITKGKTLYS